MLCPGRVIDRLLSTAGERYLNVVATLDEVAVFQQQGDHVELRSESKKDAVPQDIRLIGKGEQAIAIGRRCRIDALSQLLRARVFPGASDACPCRIAMWSCVDDPGVGDDP